MAYGPFPWPPKIFVHYFVSGNSPWFWAFQVSEIGSCNYYCNSKYLYSHFDAFCALFFQLILYIFLMFPIFLEYVFKYLAFQFLQSVRIAPGRWWCAIRKRASTEPCTLPMAQQYHSWRQSNQRVLWRWRCFVTLADIDGGKGVLYGIFKETFICVYMYILYNKGPIEVYIYMLWLSLWFMVMDVTEEEPVFFLNILW